MTPSLAVVVVSFNVRDLLAACLRSTYASLALSSDVAGRVIVVDNASADGSADMVRDHFPQVELLARPDNLGFAGGNNLALRLLGFGANEDAADRPDFVLLLNPDAEPLGNAIGEMVRFLDRTPPAGGCGARLQYGDGRFQHGAFAFPGLLQLWFDLFPPRPRRLLETRLNGRYRLALYEAGRPFPIDFPLGASLMVRRAAIEAAGPLDEGYFMYAEEVDWCWRMQRAGWPFYCVPSARVIHHGGASTGQFRAASFRNLWRSRKRLYDRFYGPARRRAASRIVRLGMQAERQRAERAGKSGALSQAEVNARLAAIRDVSEMFT